MWQLDETTTFQKDRKFYEKKRPAELAAAFRNLARYIAQLNAGQNPKTIAAGYLHHEPMGIVALDQKGGGGNLQETRLYTFADPSKQVLYLITIGNKNEQRADIEHSKDFVKSIS